ncbi:uncharacterized protein LOC127796467 [Diospyros lotus]|uniref:uncharacterized protein LOC127796467 n=1 Tax=Diospyros lotus TaxID=55363 RepID=UPI00224D4353|nr:uncharacterized protein LOC127796467 [Diospyros lotus]
MVCMGEGGGEKRVEKAMEKAPERSKPLHNFTLPRLKWGSQKFLRCMKVNPNGPVPADRRSSVSEEERGLIGRRRGPEQERRRWIERKGSFEKSPSPPGVVGGFGERSVAESDGEDGIEAVRTKLMFDLRTAADKMKVAVLSEGLEEGPPAAEAGPASEVVKPWNLRTRRAACKAPNGMDGDVNGVGPKPNVSSPLRTENKSPAVEAPTGQKRERPKFSVSLSRREIEEDFMAMACHRPPRRAKKRPKNVQKQLDYLFPGLWMTEITADMYQVPDPHDNTGKR